MNKILDKIQKTLELGKNNNNESEAQNAILAAQRLMAKYHISHEDINDFINENKDTKVIEENAVDEINNDKWKRSLMITIARNFRCDVFYREKRIILVGFKDDILITKRVYLYAKKAILNSFKIFFEENYNTFATNNSIRNKYKREFAFGFIRGLSNKFEKQKSNSELSLIVVNSKVKEHLKQMNFAGTFTPRCNRITNSYCFQEGKKKRRKLSKHRYRNRWR